MAKPKSKPKLGSREENIQELKRLQEMYNALPPGKKKAMQKPIQERMDQLNAAINSGGGAVVSALQTIVLVVLVAIIALGLGFFGISYYVRFR